MFRLASQPFPQHPTLHNSLLAHKNLKFTFHLIKAPKNYAAEASGWGKHSSWIKSISHGHGEALPELLRAQSLRFVTLPKYRHAWWWLEQLTKHSIGIATLTWRKRSRVSGEQQFFQIPLWSTAQKKSFLGLMHFQFSRGIREDESVFRRVPSLITYIKQAEKKTHSDTYSQEWKEKNKTWSGYLISVLSWRRERRTRNKSVKYTIREKKERKTGERKNVRI